MLLTPELPSSFRLKIGSAAGCQRPIKSQCFLLPNADRKEFRAISRTLMPAAIATSSLGVSNTAPHPLPAG